MSVADIVRGMPSNVANDMRFFTANAIAHMWNVLVFSNE